MNKILFVSLSLIISAAFTGCSGGGGGGGGEQGASSLTLETRQDQSTADASGLAIFTVDVPAGATGMQLVAESAAVDSLRLASIVNASGVDITASSSEVGLRLNRESISPLAVNIPYATGSLVAGSYKVAIQGSTRRNGAAGAIVSLKAFIKKDSNLSSGTLKVNLIYLGPVSNFETKEAVIESISVMRQVYGRAGITIDLQEYDYAGSANESSANPSCSSCGDAIYGQISSSLRQQAVNIVLAADIKGLAGSRTGNEYGASGSGAILASPFSAVSISILNVTGNDGIFDFKGRGGTREHNDEKRLLGEEMVRLSANYLGLENVISLRGSRVDAADSLPISPACISLTDCRESASVRTNAMLPEPLLKRRQDLSFGSNRGGQEYYERDQWSADQKAVLNASVFVD